MFNVREYLKGLSVSQDDSIVNDAKKLVEATQLLFDDAYLSRAVLWGMASACENQLTYLGGNYLPNKETALNRLTAKGVMGETDLDLGWFSNESKPHINAEDTGEIIGQLEAQIDQTVEKMRSAGIAFVVFFRAHDEITDTLNGDTGKLPHYFEIKAKAAANRASRAA